MYLDRGRHFPDFFIIGANKCGTTSLFYMLSDCSEISLSRIKEPHYFTFLGNSFDIKGSTIDPVVNEEDYLNLFEVIGGKILGEASTDYLYYAPLFIQNIQRVYGARLGDIKIIVLLRDPAERAVSHYQAACKYGFEHRDIHEAVKEGDKGPFGGGWSFEKDYYGCSLYSDKLELIKERFEHVLVVKSELLLSEPLPTMQRIFSFLEVDCQFSGHSLSLNRSGNVRWQSANNVLNFARRKAVFKKMFTLLGDTFGKQRVEQLKFTIENYLNRTDEQRSSRVSAIYDIFENERVKLKKQHNIDYIS